MLKSTPLSRQFEIIERFNPSIVLILYPLFATFSPLFDLDDAIPLIYEISTFQKLEKLLIDDVFDR